MTRIRTINQLQLMLDDEIAWRLKEIASLKTLLRNARLIKVETSTRACVTLLYAHWEGFVKGAAIAYLNYVQAQRIPYENLKECFVAAGLKKTLEEFDSTNKAERYVKALTALREAMKERARFNVNGVIRTESNLSSAVFRNV